MKIVGPWQKPAFSDIILAREGMRDTSQYGYFRLNIAFDLIHQTYFYGYETVSLKLDSMSETTFKTIEETTKYVDENILYDYTKVDQETFEKYRILK